MAVVPPIPCHLTDAAVGECHPVRVTFTVPLFGPLGGHDVPVFDVSALGFAANTVDQARVTRGEDRASRPVGAPAVLHDRPVGPHWPISVFVEEYVEVDGKVEHRATPHVS